MSLLRRGTAPTAGPDEDLDTPPAPQASRSPQTDRQTKSAQRTRRMQLVRQARQATSAMEPPEPSRGIYVSAYLLVVGLLSYLSTDLGQVYEKVNGKTKTVTENITHPATALILIVLALASAGTVYWRRRYVTGIAFMLTAAIGMGVPFPNGWKDLAYLTFIVPAGYVLWMLMFRMNKQQKAWLAAHSSASRNAPARSSGRPQGERKQQASTARSRRGREEPVVTANGRALPPSSGRYTQPRQKSRPGARKA
ncbi:MAG: hypothetical protein ABSE77_05595 [Acidimicrobiales bacterium]